MDPRLTQPSHLLESVNYTVTMRWLLGVKAQLGV